MKVPCTKAKLQIFYFTSVLGIIKRKSIVYFFISIIKKIDHTKVLIRYWRESMTFLKFWVK